MGISQIGLNALKAYQKALQVTSNNVANVNTEGYSRQEVSFTELPHRSGSAIQSITRQFSEMDTKNLRNSASAFQRSDTLYRLASALEGLVVNDELNISNNLNDLQSAINAMNANPTGTVERENFIGQANALASNLNRIQEQLSNQLHGSNQQLETMVNQLNNLSDGIANLNARIAQAPEDSKLTLMDQRDQLILEASALTNIKTIDVGNDVVSVTLANGQSLVSYNNATHLETVSRASDPSRLDIAVSGSNAIVTNQIAGGQINGILSYQDSVLTPAFNQLGLLATGISDAYNTQNKAGFDLDGAAGGNIFKDLATSAPLVIANSDNSGSATVSAQVTNVNAGVASDYLLKKTASGYELTRLSDGTALAFSGSPATVDGVEITVSGTPATGDQFLISPFRQAGGQFAVELTDPRKIALSDTAGEPGNNVNGLALAQLQLNNIFGNSTRTMSGQYTAFTSGISSEVSTARTDKEVTQALFNQARDARDSYSGVNLDEEAAKLLQYQQGFQAASQIIAVANSLFDTILSIMR